MWCGALPGREQWDSPWPFLTWAGPCSRGERVQGPTDDGRLLFQKAPELVLGSCTAQLSPLLLLGASLLLISLGGGGGSSLWPSGPLRFSLPSGAPYLHLSGNLPLLVQDVLQDCFTLIKKAIRAARHMGTQSPQRQEMSLETQQPHMEAPIRNRVNAEMLSHYCVLAPPIQSTLSELGICHVPGTPTRYTTDRASVSLQCNREMRAQAPELGECHQGSLGMWLGEGERAYPQFGDPLCSSSTWTQASSCLLARLN